MISYIKGKLSVKAPTHVILEASGIGYHIHISLNTFSKISDDENIKLFTYLKIAEDAHTLYGFADEDERNIFIHLISVSGIGTNTARLMLSSLQAAEVQQAIVNEDVKTIQSIKGIGLKTAERCILELKDKLKKEPLNALSPSFNNNKIKQEALSALTMLGFAKQGAEKGIDSVLKGHPEASVEQVIKLTLKSL